MTDVLPEQTTETVSLTSRDEPDESPTQEALVVALAGGQLDGRTRLVVEPGGLVLGRQSILGPAGKMDQKMSRRHASIERKGDVWLCTDLGSRNLSRINGQEITAAASLRPGDLLRLGDTLLLWSEVTDKAEPLAPEPGLVGESAPMRALRRSIAAVAQHAANVLITGETGAGKEMVARALHRHSGRGGPFVALNCGGLAEGVLESELFGHVRGAFTGAVAAQSGLFRAAEGGTLFLDELGEMPLGMQVKLLRVLETRRLRPVGATAETPVDVRVLAATNADLLGAVRQGRFRTDLYARLAQWLILVPPLRNRREDLPLLITHLLERLGARGRRLDAALVEALFLHRWPLNVRGLLNVLSSAVIAAPPETPLKLTDQVKQVLEAEQALAAIAVPTPAREPPAARPAEEVPMPSQAVILAALVRHRGKMVDAARALGCSRSRLYRWCATYGIDPNPYRLRVKPADGALAADDPVDTPAADSESETADNDPLLP